MNKSGINISVVIPVYNEEEVLPELHKRLEPVMKGLSGSYEIIFVDDQNLQDEEVKVNRKSFWIGMFISGGFLFLAFRKINFFTETVPQENSQ